MRKLTDEQLQELEETAWTRGQRAMATSIALRALLDAGLVAGDPAVALAAASREIHDSRNHLRDLFAEFDLEWPGDEVRISDVIEKALFRQLQARLGE